ncbi:hypothetical protein LCGC14_0417130 [marine sediment metagenome]|uniref:Uncharacterized protein n=1 Tax=marine sediment metagenome TaxID=412755 RepID=A0A0F9SY68_9ZZZZ
MVLEARGKAKDVFPAVKRLTEKYPTKTIGDFKTCQQCGHSGFNVETVSIHVGGQGYVERDYCQDIRACFARRDNENLKR